MSPSPSLTKDRAPREPTDSSSVQPAPRSPHHRSPPPPRSSRESSPERVTSRKPRSFSPESESGDSAAPQITVHGSSPPQEQPVIRQGLAFRSANISTYEPSQKTGDGNFLPGQEVQMAAEAAPPSAPTTVVPNPLVSSAGSTPAPPASSSNPATPSPHLSAMSTPSDKSAPPKAVKKGSKPITKKTKQPEDNAFTTGRFRLTQYTGTPNEGLPPIPGQQTYASVYRPPPVQPIDATPPGPTPDPSSSPVAASTANIPGTRIMMADNSPKTTKRNSKIQPFQTTQEDLADASPSQSRNLPAYTNRPTAPQQIQITTLSPQSKTNPRVTVSQPTPSAPPVMMSHSSAPQPPYYRRGHEQASQPRPDTSRPHQPSIQIAESRHIEANMAPPPPEISLIHTKGKEREMSGHRQHPTEISRPPRGNVRLVTALIEDNRTNPPDHLLAEVYIRCWSGSRPDELWCDAKDLSEELQASASRIDGPAKVFTQRGAYRQCFLRITADQEDRYNSMNLALASDRTIPISVEYWAPPAAQVKQPGSTNDWRMSWHTSPTLSPAHTTPQPAQTPQPSYSHHQHSALPHHQPHAQPSTQSHHPYYGSQAHNNDGRHVMEASRKRYIEHGSPDGVSEPPLRRPIYGSQPSGHGIYEAPSVSRNPSSAYPRKRHVVDVTSPTDDNMQVEGHTMDTRPDYKTSGYDSSQSEDVRHIVSDMIDELMKIDVTVAEYNRSLQAPNLVNTIHAYRMVDEICKKYVNRLLPVKGTSAQHKITEVDIARGLGAEDPRRYVSDCRETLWLLDLYGERGKRCENPKVLDMLKDGYHSTAKQLQKVLKEIDAQWMREHSEGPPGGSGDSRPMARMT